MGSNRQRIVIVKLGGSSITDKAQFETIDNEALSWVHKVIAQNIHSTFLGSSSSSSSSTQSNENKIEDKPAFIIIHGAGSFGHYHAKQYGLRGESDPPSIEALSSSSSSSHTTNHYMSGLAHTRNSVKTLNNMVVSSLLSSSSSSPSFSPRSSSNNNNGQNDNNDQKDYNLTSINAVGISPCINIPSLQAYGGDSHSVSLLIQSIKEALQVGLVPVIHGDAGLYGFLNNDSFQNDDDDDDKINIPKMRSGILGGDTLVEIIATSPLWDKKKNHDDGNDDDNDNNDQTNKTQIQQCIDEVVFLTDVNGVFTKDPNKYPNDAKLLKKIIIDPISGEIDSVLQLKNNDSSSNDDNDDCEDEQAEVESLEIQGSSHEHDVTGGLKAKLNSAVKVAMTGIQVKIVKCCSKTAEDVLQGCETDLGTTISRK